MIDPLDLVFGGVDGETKFVAKISVRADWTNLVERTVHRLAQTTATLLCERESTTDEVGLHIEH
jgi:hypothetical protein